MTDDPTQKAREFTYEVGFTPIVALDVELARMHDTIREACTAEEDFSSLLSSLMFRLGELHTALIKYVEAERE